MSEHGDDPVRRLLARRGYAQPVVDGGLARLVERWERVAEDTERGYSSTFDEWLDDMDGRRILDEALTVAVDPERAELVPRIEIADRRFARAVEPFGHCVWGRRNARLNGWSPATAPWYFVRPRILGDELRNGFEYAAVHD